MKNKTALFALVAVAGLTAAGTAWVYPQLPAVVVTHWNVRGAPNGTMSRAWGAWLPMGLMVGLAALLWVVPYIDPRRQNYAAFRKVYNLFVVGMVVFLAYVQALSLAWNLGYHLPLAQMLAPALGGVFLAVGRLLQAARPNWFVGIRTPWTLSSPSVWRKTHRVGVWVFFLAGVVMFAGAMWEPALWVSVGLVGMGSLAVVVYSWAAYERERRSAPPPSRDI